MINNVTLIGRVTYDPKISYTQSQSCVAKFTVAINRGKDKNGNDLGADFPNIVALSKLGELVERYVTKGMLIAVSGRINTNAYEDKDGKKVYTTQVVAERLDFLDRKKDSNTENKTETDPVQTEIPAGFTALQDSDIPF